MKNDEKSIWLCIPCYNPTASDWQRLEDYLKAIQARSSTRIDTVVVDDCSPNWVEPPLSLTRICQVVRKDINFGKGSAIRTGLEMMPATSTAFAFTDFDAPYTVDNLVGVTAAVVSGSCDLCIGDRTFDNDYASTVRKSRRLSHHLFRFMVRTMIAGGVSDTQCGLKAFDANVAREILKLSKVDGFLFDLEWIYIALHHNLTIRKWPVSLQTHHESSKLRFFGNPKLFVDFFMILKLIVWRKYESSHLRLWSEESRRNLLSEFSKS